MGPTFLTEQPENPGETPLRTGASYPAFLLLRARKVVVDGVVDLAGERAFVLRFLQARDPALVGRPFFADSAMRRTASSGEPVHRDNSEKVATSACVTSNPPGLVRRKEKNMQK